MLHEMFYFEPRNSVPQSLSYDAKHKLWVIQCYDQSVCPSFIDHHRNMPALTAQHQSSHHPRTNPLPALPGSPDSHHHTVKTLEIPLSLCNPVCFILDAFVIFTIFCLGLDSIIHFTDETKPIQLQHLCSDPT